jgi:hypothetical protein
MNMPRNSKGLAILAGGLAFVGSANAVDLIINGSFEAELISNADATPTGWSGVCQGYSYSAAYFTGPPIPASENPGSTYTWRHRSGVDDTVFATPMTQMVDLLAGASAANIDAGRAQYTFSAWLASYGQPGSNPEQPYLTLRFMDASSVQIGTTVVFDRVTGTFFNTFADGVTVFDSASHLHDWAKYVRTSSIPPGARKAIVGIQHSPNAGLSNNPDTYTDLVKLDVVVTDTRPSLDSATPSGANAPGDAPVRITLQDGSVTVNQNSIVLSFDNASVSPTVSKVGSLTTITYSPGLLPAGSAHTYRVIFADNGTPVRSQTNDFSFTVANYASVPASYAKPAGSASTPGFTFRTVQAPGGGLANTLARARAQLAGTLIDPTTGQPYPNSATPGPNVDGSYNVDGVLNFEQSAASAGNFPNDQAFPGLAAMDQDNFSTEAVLFLDLAQGYYRFGVNSDDGFEVRIGTDPLDVLSPSTVLGFFDDGRGTADTLFDFYIPVTGVYCVRVIFFEGTGGAAEEFFSVNPSTGAKTLINDLATAGSIHSYRVLTGVARPYVRDASPAPGATDAPVDTSLVAHIWDRTTAVVNGSVQLTLNGNAVPATVSKNGIVTTVTYQPSSPLAFRTTYTVQLSYGDGGGTIVKSWTFTTRGADQPPGITGQWDFDSGDLSATLGLPLEYFGSTAALTQFGSTTSFGISNIAGFPANVVKLPAAVNNTIGLLMRHGAVPNGGVTATKVNQWTLIMDIYIPVQSGQWHSFVQIDSLDNSNDGELFANFGSSGGTSGGLGITGNYSAVTNITKGNWHRVAFAVDSSTIITKYIDGVKSGDQTTWSGQGLDGRHAMMDRAILFGDESGEGLQCYLNSVQFRNYKMRDSELEALGGPDANGISTTSGQWDFNNQTAFNDGLRATIGTDMTLLPETEFSTTFLSVPFGFDDANVMLYSASANTDGYVIVPGALGNGGGQKINKYSLIMDLQIPASAIDSWHSLWQTVTNNSSDASLFIRPASSGSGVGISGTYHGNILPDTWYRLAFTFDLTTRVLKKYTNGVLAGQQTLSEGVDGRWSVSPTALLFADNDGDNDDGLCNSVQFHPRVLSDAEVALLGRPSAAGIPVSIPHPLTIISIVPTFFDIEIKWVGGNGPFQVQTRDSFSTGTWIDSGVPTQDRMATVPRGPGNVFIRVFGQ